MSPPSTDTLDYATEKRAQGQRRAARRRKILDAILIAILIIIIALVGIGIFFAIKPDLFGQLLKLF